MSYFSHSVLYCITASFFMITVLSALLKVVLNMKPIVSTHKHAIMFHERNRFLTGLK